ncbi:MAG TPA: phosphoribosylformylglycinamidine synthase [Dehalococcoidia bacterium]|jgi:phosphoribosylformylglycinamidine synthase PurS subunit|nr:phosphoribosylformylglycinamidine synthase [Dehalococcoidia bacterium]|tara:strand:- start:5696 stop:5953 length:258 start_codon:yes stop_codon:yes gene_type:complete
MLFRATIKIMLKQSVNDPQGNAVLNGLNSLGFKSVENVRVGKFIAIDLQASNEQSAESQVTDMCEKLLANTVIESFDFVLDEITT